MDDDDDTEFKLFNDNSLSLFDQPCELNFCSLSSVVLGSEDIGEKVEMPESSTSVSILENDENLGRRDQSATEEAEGSSMEEQLSENGTSSFRDFLNKIFKTNRREKSSLGRVCDKVNRIECFSKYRGAGGGKYHRSASTDELGERSHRSSSFLWLNKGSQHRSKPYPSMQRQRPASESSLPHSTLLAECFGNSVHGRHILSNASKQGR